MSGSSDMNRFLRGRPADVDHDDGEHDSDNQPSPGELAARHGADGGAHGSEELNFDDGNAVLRRALGAPPPARPWPRP
jgi:hypothetical protein